MRAVIFQAPGEVRFEERPEPELFERDDAIVRVEATGCVSLRRANGSRSAASGRFSERP